MEGAESAVSEGAVDGVNSDIARCAVSVVVMEASAGCSFSEGHMSVADEGVRTDFQF